MQLSLLFHTHTKTHKISLSLSLYLIFCLATGSAGLRLSFSAEDGSRRIRGSASALWDLWVLKINYCWCWQLFRVKDLLPIADQLPPQPIIFFYWNRLMRFTFFSLHFNGIRLYKVKAVTWTEDLRWAPLPPSAGLPRRTAGPADRPAAVAAASQGWRAAVAAARWPAAVLTGWPVGPQGQGLQGWPGAAVQVRRLNRNKELCIILYYILYTYKMSIFLIIILFL